MVIEDDSGCIQQEADTEVEVDDSEDKSESIAEVKLNGEWFLSDLHKGFYWQKQNSN